MNKYKIIFMDKENPLRSINFDSIVQITFIDGKVNIIYRTAEKPLRLDFKTHEYLDIIIEKQKEESEEK